MNRDEFEAAIIDFIQQYDGVYFILAKLDRGETPIGVVTAKMTQRIMEPHVDWFPWSNLRVRVEGIAAFADHMGKRFKLITAVSTDDAPLFQRLAKYGIIRKVGTVHQYYDDGDATVFESSQRVE